MERFRWMRNIKDDLVMVTPVLVRISDKLICYYMTHLHYYSIEIRPGTAVIVGE